MKLALAVGKQAWRIADTAAAHGMHLSWVPFVPTNPHCCKRNNNCRTLKVQPSQIFFGVMSRGCDGKSSGEARMTAPTVLRSG